MPGAVLGPFWEAPGVVLEAFGEPPGWIFDGFPMFFFDGKSIEASHNSRMNHFAQILQKSSINSEEQRWASYSQG